MHSTLWIPTHYKLGYDYNNNNRYHNEHASPLQPVPEVASVATWEKSYATRIKPYTLTDRIQIKIKHEVNVSSETVSLVCCDCRFYVIVLKDHFCLQHVNDNNNGM